MPFEERAALGQSNFVPGMEGLIGFAELYERQTARSTTSQMFTTCSNLNEAYC